MTLVFLIISLLALSYVLSRSTDILVSGISQLSENTSLESSGITIIFVALATSLPELFVGVAGALQGESSLPLGMVVGSNIANISLVIGGAAVISGLVKARDHVYSQDLVYAFLVGSLPLLLLLDRSLSRMDGAVLLLVYVLFNWYTLSGRKRQQLEKVEERYYEAQGITHRILSYVGRKDVEQGMGKLIVGSGLLIVCSDLIIRLAMIIASQLNAPVLLVGLFMVSVGTSLPELAFEIKTIAKREYLMAFGNITGSTVVNSSLVLGAVAVLSPIVLTPETARSYFISVMGFVVISGAFWFMTFTRKKLERWEGAVLLLMYFGFAVVQLQLS